MTSHPDTVTALVEIAAEAIRSANHRTLTTGRLPVPETYRVLGELSNLAQRLPQLCDQLAANLKHRDQPGRLRLDHSGQRRYTNPAEAITAARTALDHAARLAQHLAAALDQAHNATAVIADTGPQPPTQPAQESDPWEA